MWFAAFMRRETDRGAFVMAVKRGSQQAGALFVIHNHLNGTASLYAPAPQAYFEDEPTDRLFEKALDTKPTAEIDDYLEKQKRFDPDLWIIETELGTGEPALELAK